MKTRYQLAVLGLLVLLSWFPGNALAQTQIATFGSSGLDHGGKIGVAPNGDLLLVGAIHEGASLPDEGEIYFLSEDIDGDHRGFVARYSPDGSQLQWLALFPAETFVPSLVTADENVIALAGDPLSAMSLHFPSRGSSYQAGALVLLNADGRTVIGARDGLPNTPYGLDLRDGEHRGYQAGITGLSLHQGLLYATGGTSGRGMAAYIARYDTTTLEVVHFPGRPDPQRTWAIDLHRNLAPDLVDSFYWRYDRNHEDAEFHQGDCRINLHGNRRGGQVLVTEYDGGTIFATFDIQYDFNCVGTWFPAFDAIIAAWNLEGELKWVTNGLDQMVSEPDQGPQAMAWDALNERLVVGLWQHGSNVARLPGELVGTTGNISIGWIGSLDPATGEVLHARYQHAVQQDSNGSWTEHGSVTGWPQNSGNNIREIIVDGEGQVIVAGRGGNQMFTTADALQDWPLDLWGGHTILTVLSPDLSEVRYATVLRGEDLDSAQGSSPSGLAINAAGLFVFGETSNTSFLRINPDSAPWSTEPRDGENSLYFARLASDSLPFSPRAPEPGLEPIPSDDEDTLPGDDFAADPNQDDGNEDVDSPREEQLRENQGRDVEGCQCSLVGGSSGGGSSLVLLFFGYLLLRRSSRT